MNYGDVSVKKSKIAQFEDGFGVFTNRDFKKDEVVIEWNLKTLTDDEYNQLPEYEKNNFCHKREGLKYYYSIPERYVNRSANLNVFPDFERQADIALKDIKSEKNYQLWIR